MESPRRSWVFLFDRPFFFRDLPLRFLLRKSRSFLFSLAGPFPFFSPLPQPFFPWIDQLSPEGCSVFSGYLRHAVRFFELGVQICSLKMGYSRPFGSIKSTDFSLITAAFFAPAAPPIDLPRW